MENKFSTDFQIYTYQADSREYARPNCLFGFFIEAASMHAEELNVGHAMLRERFNAFWALSKFHLDIIDTPRWHQTVKVTTWPAEFNRLFSRRYFQITCDGKIMAQGSSDWVIMDYGTRNLCNAETILKQIPEFVLTDEHLESKTSKVPMPNKDMSNTFNIKSRYSHLDMNNHVNSIHYLDWAIDCIDNTYLREHLAKTVDLNFQHEIPINEDVALLCQKFDNDKFTVAGLSADKTLFLAKMEFAQNQQ